MKNLKPLYLLLFLFIGNILFASDLEIIPYQGSIANSAGTPYSGSYEFIFEIQNNSGATVWNSGSITLNVNLGAYSVLLGQSPSSSIPDTIWKNNDSLYLEISFNDGVNGIQTLNPRVEFLPVPRSITSKYSEKFCGDSIDLTTITSTFSSSHRTITDTIITKIINIYNQPFPPLESLVLESTETRFNCPNGTFSTTKNSTGGSIKAVDTGTGNEVEAQMDALDEIMKLIFDNGVVVLPNPTSDEKANLEEDKLRFENQQTEVEQGVTPDGAFIKALDKLTGNTVEQHLDAVNKVFKFINGPVVVLPNPFANEVATLEEDKLLIENATQTMEQVLAAQGGSTIVTETSTGKEVAQFLDAINDVVGVLAETTKHSNGGTMGHQETVDDVNNIIAETFNDGPINMSIAYDPSAGIVASQGVIEEIQEDGTGLALTKSLDGIARTADLIAIDGTNNVGFKFDPNFNTTFHQGNLNVLGNIAKFGGTFKIDHPKDPYNKYLIHSFVESPDMMNIYNGNIVTDDNGIAVVKMPEYFSSLNMNFRYQLTVIGDFAQAAIAEEIDDNTFIIMTDKSNVKVSWQVTGVRQDTYANENRVQAVVEKEENMKGKLMYEPKTVKAVKAEKASF